MVTTRAGAAATTHHPSTSPSPSPSSSPATMATTSKKTSGASSKTTNAAGGGGARSSSSSVWLHAPGRTTLFWLAVSLPLVAWDSVYVLGRPHTMEGGRLFWPLYVPYKLYGEVDHVYGWKAYRARSGFTAAQGSLNVVETALYLAYLWLWFARAQRVNVAGRGRVKVLAGRPAAVAVLLAFAAAVMTLSKTVLYWLNEYYSGFDNIGHNSIRDLIPLWIIPNGAWLIFPSYMIYVMGSEIIEGLTAASTGVSGIKAE